MGFKVGDSVRIINENICGKNKIGKVCRVFLNDFGNIKKDMYEVDIGAAFPYDIYEEDLELYEEKAKEDEIVEKTLNKFGVTMNDLKNNDLLCLSLVALLFSQDGAKIFKEIWEERKRNNEI